MPKESLSEFTIKTFHSFIRKKKLNYAFTATNSLAILFAKSTTRAE